MAADKDPIELSVQMVLSEHCSDIDTPTDKPQPLLMQKSQRSLCWAVVIGNTVQLYEIRT